MVESKALRSGRRHKPALEDGDVQPDGQAAFLPPPRHRACKREHSDEDKGRHHRSETPLALDPSGFKPCHAQQPGLTCENLYFYLIYHRVKLPSVCDEKPTTTYCRLDNYSII